MLPLQCDKLTYLPNRSFYWIENLLLLPPVWWAALGLGLGMGMSVIGAAW